MKIGFLQCDHVLPQHRSLVFGDYDYLYSQVLRSAAKRLNIKKTIKFVTYQVIDGIFPNSPTECDAWIVTSSHFSVNDDLLWMIRLVSFIRKIFSLRITLVGICFGHQIISRAFGGTIHQRNNWVIGVKCIKFLPNPVFSSPTIRLLGIHRDEVIDPPSVAKVIASTSEIHNASMIILPTVLTIQYHFELPREYYLALLHLRRNIISKRLLSAAIMSLSEETDENRVADSILSFLISGGIT